MRAENTFIAADGVGEVTERRLWTDGVTHWDDFDPALLGPKTGEAVEGFIADARDRLDAGDAAFFDRVLPDGELWRVYENFADGAAFLDIETTGLDARASEVTTASVHRGGETRTYVRGRDLDAGALARELADASLLVTFNGKRFDVPFLEGAFDLDVTTPHVDLLYPCQRLDLTGGLKRVEREVGIDREGVEDVDGREAVRLWRRYRRGDEAALDRLVRYNRLDAENLRPLMDEVADRLHDDVFATHL